MPSTPKPLLPSPFTLLLISELHPHEEVMKLEKGERKNRGGVVGRWKEPPSHLGEVDDDRRHVPFSFPAALCVFYLLDASRKKMYHSWPMLSLFFSSLQELIEVDSEVVFELASYILQVRWLVFACECVCRRDVFPQHFVSLVTFSK